MATASFADCFGEWVEAVFFGEPERAAEQLDEVLDRPAVVLEAQSLAIIARMLEPFVGVSEQEVAEALAAHLMSRPDAERRALIAAVVHHARFPREPIPDDPDEAATALECASFLVQLAAERKGVVPTSILKDL